MSGTKAERRAKFDAESIKIIQRISNSEISGAIDSSRTTKGRKARGCWRNWYAASAEVAETLINTDFNAYVGAQDTSRALSFINVWGKTWGVPPATISDQPSPAGPCVQLCRDRVLQYEESDSSKNLDLWILHLP